MIVLTPRDYRVQPWANGRGTTTELARQDGAAGLDWRLSMAQVTEAGPFSIFPGIDRSLTVIDGPGFVLSGPQILQARPMQPVSFPGDVAIAAQVVTGPAVDFNVMWARDRYTACVTATPQARLSGEVIAVLAVDAGTITLDGQPRTLGRHDLVLARAGLSVAADTAILAVTLRRI